MGEKCRICSSDTSLLGSSLVMGKHDARYYACGNCGFVAVADPYWLAEAYQSPIARVDLGSVWRAYRYSKAVKALINFGGFHRDGMFLDYGGGYGLFVRQMRDLGYDFRYHDSYCENLFAQGFEADLDSAERFEMLTAFEVFEHLQDPMATIERLAAFSSTIVFSTSIIPTPPPKIGEWWYYLPVTGQHISFYSHKSLEIIAKRLGMRSYSQGKEIHMLSARAVPKLLYAIVSNPRLAKWLDLFWGRPTLLYKDFDQGLDRAHDQRL
jgi:ribosomal protein S27AE